MFKALGGLIRYTAVGGAAAAGAMAYGEQNESTAAFFRRVAATVASLRGGGAAQPLPSPAAPQAITVTVPAAGGGGGSSTLLLLIPASALAAYLASGGRGMDELMWVTRSAFDTAVAGLGVGVEGARMAAEACRRDLGARIAELRGAVDERADGLEAALADGLGGLSAEFEAVNASVDGLQQGVDELAGSVATREQVDALRTDIEGRLIAAQAGIDELRTVAKTLSSSTVHPRSAQPGPLSVPQDSATYPPHAQRGGGGGSGSVAVRGPGGGGSHRARILSRDTELNA